MRCKKILLLVLVGFLFLAACELFQPRDPQPPSDGNSPYQWLQPTTWEIVLTDLELAFKALNQKYFLDVLADTATSDEGFTFIPDPNVAHTSGQDFTNWGYTEESQFLEAIFSRLSTDTTNTLTWFNKIETTLSLDEMQIQADYQLHLKFKTASRETYPEHLSGRALLLIKRQNNNYWQITRWEDAGNDSMPSWTYLKTLQ
ncbi:MAG: hypothetical protein K9N11_02505 [Lentisphaeria bacterium]|nr:hypothetical protein [Candidatus Neomarinimicrobiota bacterium]MCF7841701.1 hypothetical protein [Lentisphaeria bacterium]